MHTVSWLCSASLAGAFCLSIAAQDGSKPNLNGKWQLVPAKSQMQMNKLSGLTLQIAESDGKIAIDENQQLADGKERRISYACPTDGKECDVPDTGAKASFWYNGPVLVSMETEKKGGSVVRQRLSLSPDSKELTLEISSLVPQSDKSDKLVLEKTQ